MLLNFWNFNAFEGCYWIFTVPFLPKLLVFLLHLQAAWTDPPNHLWVESSLDFMDMKCFTFILWVHFRACTIYVYLSTEVKSAPILLLESLFLLICSCTSTWVKNACPFATNGHHHHRQWAVHYNFIINLIICLTTVCFQSALIACCRGFQSSTHTTSETSCFGFINKSTNGIGWYRFSSSTTLYFI